MKLNYTLLVIFFLILVTVHCADTDLEVKKTPNGGDLGRRKPSISNQNENVPKKEGNLDTNLDSKKADPLKKGKDLLSDSQTDQNANLVKDNPSKQLGNKEAENVQTDANNGKSVKGVEKKEKADKGLGSKDVPKEEDFPATRKENFRGEQCDSSFTCTIDTDENNALVACLRVPGNESPELSLLIQNKGKGPLSVKISAPDFVHLEKTEIQLPEAQEQKIIKVSIGEGKTDKFIVLNTGKGNCSLNFRNFLTHNPMKKSNYMLQLTYIDLFLRTPFLGFVFLAILLVIASILMYVSFKRRQFAKNGSKYQKLDMEIPVFDVGPKTDLEVKDGWEDSWSDGWDDVEAPSTPSMPVTPSLSVASRRINKEGWKD